jgi:hypothetical protein
MARSYHVMIKLSRLGCKNHYGIVPFAVDFELVSNAGFVKVYQFELLK